MSRVLLFVVFFAASMEPALPATQQVVLYQRITLFELKLTNENMQLGIKKCTVLYLRLPTQLQGAALLLNDEQV
jgi:hypothetical protein